MIFARPEVLPFLPGAPTVVRVHGFLFASLRHCTGLALRQHGCDRCPSALLQAAWEGPMPFRRYSILGDNLSAIAGSLARFALEDYQALREMYAEGC